MLLLQDVICITSNCRSREIQPPAKKKIENSAQAIAYIDFGKNLVFMILQVSNIFHGFVQAGFLYVEKEEK